MQGTLDEAEDTPGVSPPESLSSAAKTARWPGGKSSGLDILGSVSRSSLNKP
ncbi:MAG: hypothetical protein JNM65_03610 [Verrucomicrobiaceae bacterium]|nr:hypothetical protein [Verrucomicrobiaceae bacterium]